MALRLACYVPCHNGVCKLCIVPLDQQHTIDCEDFGLLTFALLEFHRKSVNVSAFVIRFKNYRLL